MLHGQSVKIKNMQLSILICSTHTRRNNFLPRIMNQVYGQYEALTIEQQNEVEIIVLTDNKKIMLGEKRNSMIDISQGKYVVFVDDDDRISDNYIISLLEACETNCDVITFKADVSINGAPPKPCIYTSKIKGDYNDYDVFYRLPNHISCSKREIALKALFPSITYQEDSAYAKLLLPHIKSEHHIDKVLYFYDFNETTTETQQHLNARRRYLRSRPVVIAKVDVIILSNAKNDYFKSLTQQAVDTCIQNSFLPVNVIVMEQKFGVHYAGANTYYCSDEFNYNAFANKGASLGYADWIMIANNDLIFKPNWLQPLLDAKNEVVSPVDTNNKKQLEIIVNTLGSQNGVYFSGWCFMLTRKLWRTISGFDKDFPFWFADDAVIEQVKKELVMPMLVPGSQVTHIGSATLKTETKEEIDARTWAFVDKFNSKYGKTKFVNSPQYQKWKSRVT